MQKRASNQALPILDDLVPHVDFDRALGTHNLGPLTRAPVSWLQVNVGKLCNQACHHCHVEAGPTRSEIMTEATAERVLALLQASPSIEKVDFTGGAPELNPSFRRLVREVRRDGRHVIDRCNLTVLSEPGQEDTAHFLAEHDVEIVASLPCYSERNVDQQRGRGVFDKSVQGLKRLNELGYGRGGSRVLNLVYNPVGAFLPPPQATLEADYKRELQEKFGIVFDGLFTITNMPIKRFAEQLIREGKEVSYMELLADSFNPGTVEGLMCRHLVSVGWDGRLYDCDFNQMLDMELGADGPAPTLWDIESFEHFVGRRIATAPHCFGCTAGAGSSCGGTLDA